MTKLWHKDKEELDQMVESFETKDDLLLDKQLIKYDVIGSIAHAKMLYKIGLLANEELKKLLKGLNEIVELADKGEFVLELGDEDVHTKIENYLTKNCGTAGKKIHTARSRNDQVLTALRLYSKDKLEEVVAEVDVLISSFKKFNKDYGAIQMPGYTHMQKAMPSSFDLWSGSFIANLQDDQKTIKHTYKVIDQSPLGSAAGYGVPLELDKKYTAKLMDFSSVQENPIYCQNSRGKFETIMLAGLISILLTINKLASDVMLFSTTEFGFLSASDKVTTGSSIMPQKKNLDLAELLRSKVHLVLGNYCKLVSLSSNLPSGYNRDLQDSKKPLMESFDITIGSLKMAQILLKNIVPVRSKLEASMTEELYATQKALEMAVKGNNFRDAYRKVGKEISKKEGGDKYG